MIPAAKMTAAKAARRNTTVHMHDFYLPNDPFQDPFVGRRTGVPLNIRARKDSNGFDNIDDYFPDTDPEEENIVPNEQNSDRDLLVGRRTGISLNTNPRNDSKGFESVDDYFPDSVHDDQVEDIPEGASENPDKRKAPETPGEQVESPNETGTIIKNPVSREPTPQINGPIMKRSEPREKPREKKSKIPVRRIGVSMPREKKTKRKKGLGEKKSMIPLRIKDIDGEEMARESKSMRKKGLRKYRSKIPERIKDIDGKEMALENKWKGKEDSNHKVVVQGVKTQKLDTTVQRKGRAGKTKDNNEIENDGKFGEVVSKRRERKSLRDQKTGQSEGQRLIEEAEVSFKARKGKKGKGKETTKVSPDGGQKDVLDIVAGRKRQMNVDKSHSGGRDADDESVLPAKQPNRKRLSTVSFTSSPFVHASPADLTPSAASRRSPLACLPSGSNGNSDLSFTPWSGRTVRSSVGSASSVSGAGDSGIDPDEEVTLSHDDGQQEGGWAIKGVLRNPTSTPKTRKKFKAKRPTARKHIHDLFHTPGMLHFTNPSGNPATDDDPLIAHKFISQPLLGVGQVILRPGAEKRRPFVRNDTMVFYVLKGKIMFTIHQSSVVLNTGSTFFVPQGNFCNIKNLKQTDAKLMFVQIKG